MIKTKLDNDVTDHIGAIYVENKIELSWPIQPSAVYDENQKRQRCDRTYKCSLRQ